MAAPQQSGVPIYKETANIRAKDVDYWRFEDRDTAGASLARLLGVLPDAAQKMKAKKDKAAEPGDMEKAQKIALAQMGATADRVRLAKGSSVFGLLQDKEGSLDAFEVNRGRREADLFAGSLRDAYAASGLADSDDPKAFQTFVQQRQKDIFAKLQGSDPSYYTGYLERIGGVFEEMTKAHAGNLDTFIEGKNKRALEARIGSRVAVELAANKERTAYNVFMDSLMGAESGGNYNAFHGNANNQRIRFTDMSVGEVLEWQKSGAWKKLGASSSAVGKYQFIDSTLSDVVRRAGIDLKAKFTPQLQDQLMFYRLTQDRGMMDYLEDKISAEDFLDKGLALEFAGLKKTSGKGHYDGDGKNKASLSSRKSIAALIAFKEAYLRDPAKVTKEDKGRIVLNGGDADDIVDPDNSEEEFGVDTPTARAEVANAIIKELEANPANAGREDLEDYMARKRLPKADRDRVTEARDRILDETKRKADIADQRATQEILGLADKYIRQTDDASLEAIKAKNPAVYKKLLELQTSPADPEAVDNDAFLRSADYSSARFHEDALKAYASGSIDQETYTQAMEQHDIMKTAKPVLAMPGIKPFVSKLRETIPGDDNRAIFDAQLALAVDDLMKVNDGKRPSLTDLQAAATQVHQSLLGLQQQDQQSRLSRPEYQLGNKS